MTFDVRLRAFQPGTDTPLRVLPEPLSWEASVVHNNDGALTVKYSELADGGTVAARSLNDGLDVALEANWAGTWVEPDNCRFLKVGDSYDRSDPAKVHDVSLVSWSWLLNKVCDLNTGALAGSKSKNAGMRVFAATADVGDVVKAMLDEHDARTGPAVPIVRDTWSGTADSLGAAWSKKLGKNTDGRAFPAGQSLHDKIDAFVANGFCDWRTRGRGLRIYNPSTGSADLSATVRLRYGDDLADAPSAVSQADRVARILVKGDGKHKVSVSDPAVPEFYGRWEALIDSAGVKDDDDLEDAGQAALADRNRIKGEHTRALTMAGTFLPFRDYNVGDWVTAPGADGDERLRVMQITITRDGQAGLSGNVVLGDRFTNADLALAGRVSAITAGTTGVIGNGTVGTTLPQDTRVPAAPSGLTITDTPYLTTFRRWQVRIKASWNAVATATDGTALEVAGYELWGQPQGQTPDAIWRRITSSSTTSVEWDGFAPNSAWLFTVRAMGVTTTEPGVQSATVAITLGNDTTPPNQPSAAAVSSRLGALRVGWDGKDYLGGAMPTDYDRCDVHVSTVSGFTPSAATRQTSIALAGSVSIDGLTYGTTYYAKLVAYDWAGNASTPSAQASAVLERVVTNDMVNAAITNVLLAPGAVTNDKVAAHSLLAGSLAVTDWTNYATNGDFVIGPTAGAKITGWTAGTWDPQTAQPNEMRLYTGAGDIYSACETKSSATGGDQFWMSFAVYRAGTSGFNDVYLSLACRDAAGTEFQWPGVMIPAATIQASPQTWLSASGGITLPAGTVQVQPYIAISGNGTAGLQYQVRSVHVYRRNGGELIVDGAITANKLETDLVLATNIYAGDPASGHVKINNAGLYRNVYDPDEGAVVESFHLGGTGSDWLAFRDGNQRVTASIDATGNAAFSSVQTGSLQIAGLSVEDYLVGLPKGIIGWASHGADSSALSTKDAEVVYIEFRANLERDRMYEVKVGSHLVDATASGVVFHGQLRAAYDGNAVSTSSALMSAQPTKRLSTNTWQTSTAPLIAILSTAGQPNATREARFAYCIQKSNPAGDSTTARATSTTPIVCTVTDIGPAIELTTSIITRTSTWVANGGQAVGGDGQARTDATYTGYANTPYTVGPCYNGQNWSQVLFTGNDVETNTTSVGSAMGGTVTIVKAEIYLYAQYSQNSNVDVQVRPNTLTSLSLTAPSGAVVAAEITEGSGKWIDITSLWTTGMKGIWITSADSTADKHGHFRSHAYSNNSTKPQLRLTYRK